MPTPTLTYFDYSFFYYTSFFLQGFISNARERGYKFALSHQIPPDLRDRGLDTAFLFDFGLRGGLYRYEFNGQTILFCLEASNQNSEFSETLLELCDLYFKVNYQEDVIANHPQAAPYAHKIVPVDNVWPVAPPHKWRFLPKLTPLGGRPWPMPLIKRRLRWLRTYPTLDQYRTLRLLDKDIDVFFVTTYRLEDKHGDQNLERLVLMEELSKRKDLNLVLGFASPVRDIPGEYARWSMPYIPYEEYLNLLARSRIGLYVRGTFGCLSTKFGEQMALGKAVVGESLLNNRENMYAYDCFAEQFAYDDPHQMVDRIDDLLGHPDRLSELEAINTATFERYLAPRPITAAILDVIEARK